jgi:hypothetical protein
MANPLPPGPIHIIVHTAPAEWWQILAVLGPYGVLLVAVIWWCIELNKIRRQQAAELRALEQELHMHEGPLGERGAFLLGRRSRRRGLNA